MVRDEPGPTRHLGECELERFMLGTLRGIEARIVVRHLLTGCQQCLKVTRQLWRFGDEALLKLPKKRVPGEATGVPARPETPI